MRAPRLESAGILGALLFVKIVGIKNQRLPARIEHPPIGFVRLPISLNVIDLRDLEVASAHELSDVAVVREKLFLLIDRSFTIMQQAGQIGDFGFEPGDLLSVLLDRGTR